MGALPGTIRTATVILLVNGLGAGESGLATVSLAGVSFNEVEGAPAAFGTLALHVERAGDLRIELSSMGDTIEAWPRWTAKREFSIQVANTGTQPLSNRATPLLLSGFPVAVVPKASEFSRLPALPVTNSGGVVRATDKLGAPLLCHFTPLLTNAASTAAGGDSGTGGDSHFRFVQSIAASVWTIPHNLGKHPSTTVVDSAGTVVEGEVQHLDQSTVRISFFAGNNPVAFAGEAYCN